MTHPGAPSSRLMIADRSELRLLDHIGTPAWVFDVTDHRMWWANAPGVKFWGASSLRALCARDFSGDDAALCDRMRSITATDACAEPTDGFWTFSPMGEPLVLRLSSQPVKLDTGRDAILFELRDPAPVASHQKMLQAALTSPVMLTCTDETGTILSQNPAADACYGALAGSAQKIQTRFVDRALPETMLRMASSRETLSWQTEILGSSGTAVHLLSPIRTEDPATGQVMLVFGEMRMTDFAALLETQISRNSDLEDSLLDYTDKLRASEERYARAVKTASIWDWNITENRLYLSPSFVDRLGYDQQDLDLILSDSQFANLVHEDDRHAVPTLKSVRTLTKDSFFSQDLRVIRKSGTPLWVNVQGTVFVDDTGTPVQASGLLTDISERKQLEQKLLGSQRMEAVGQLTGGVAHEFNNLLTVVLGNAELLSLSDQPAPELLSEIVSAAQRGADLTRHMLAFARKQPLRAKLVRLEELIPRLSATLLRLLGDSISIRHEVDPDLWPVKVDADQLESALLNVALNARDAMPDGGSVTLACRNTQIPSDGRDTTLTPGAYVQIDVSDTGTGMTSETAARAFEPFFTTKVVGKGTGLGLSMVIGFSQQSGGDTLIDSQPGQGTTVSLLLPRAPETTDSTRRTERAKPARATGKTIHILEDDTLVSGTICQLLGSLGHDCTVSHSCEEAIADVSSGPFPDIFLIDLVLAGGRSGLEFANWVLTRDPSARIILMTGHSESLNALPDTAQTSSHHVLRKPFSRKELNAALSEVIARP